MIRTVISDLGRVVLWFDNDIFLRKLAERSRRSFAEVKAAVHGDLELLRRFDGGAVTPAGFHARVMEIVGADMAYGDFYAIYNDIFTPNPAVIGASWNGPRRRAASSFCSRTRTPSVSASSAAAFPRSPFSTASSCPTSSGC